MRRLFILAALALGMSVAAQSVQAQKVQMGVRAGIGTQNFKLGPGVYDAKARLGWNLAAVSQFRLVGFGSGMMGAGLYLQPEIVYSQNTVKMNAGIEDDIQPRDFKTRMSTVDIPLLLSAKVSIVSVQAGPVFNVMTKFATTKGEGEVMPERSAVGYALGASVDLGLLTLDGRYHGDFGKFKSSVDSGGSVVDGVKGSIGSWALGVGIMF